MTPSTKKLVVVLGATGAQGSPVAKYLLSHSSHLYHIRAVTRNASKPVSIELKSLGAEVVEADFSHETSITEALSGAWAVFAITNFWDQANYDLEVTQGKLINRVASQIPSLSHYIFSSLPDGRKLAGGNFQNILPYNAKAEIREDIKRYPALWNNMAEVLVAYYFQNWLKYPVVFAPRKANGEWVLEMPFEGNKNVPMAWANDVGPVVDGILKGGEEFKGKKVSVVGEEIGHQEMLGSWSKYLGVKVTFKQVTPEEFVERMKKSGLPHHIALAATELCQALVVEDRILGDMSVVSGKTLLPKGYNFKSWEEYVREEDWSPML